MTAPLRARGKPGTESPLLCLAGRAKSATKPECGVSSRGLRVPAKLTRLLRRVAGRLQVGEPGLESLSPTQTHRAAGAEPKEKARVGGGGKQASAPAAGGGRLADPRTPRAAPRSRGRRPSAPGAGVAAPPGSQRRARRQYGRGPGWLPVHPGAQVRPLQEGGAGRPGEPTQTQTGGARGLCLPPWPPSPRGPQRAPNGPINILHRDTRSLLQKGNRTRQFCWTWVVLDGPEKRVVLGAWM